MSRRFDYMRFEDNYGVVFDADRYSPSEAIEIFKNDYDIKDALDVDFDVYEIRVKWFPRMTADEMWYWDIYDNKENKGIYRVVEDENVHKDPDNKGFKCWRVRYDKAHEEVRNAYSN